MKLRRCLLLVLWILSLASISFFGGAVSYGVFFGVTLIPVASLLYIVCVYLRFKIYQEVGSRSMVCGRPESYFFILKNEDYFVYSSVSVRFFDNFSYVEELPGDVEYELFPGESFTYETRLVCKYRGEYEVGIKDVVVTDFLRLFRVRYENRGVVKALVRPRVVALEELKSIEEIPVALLKEISARTQQDILVRDYYPGDTPGQIHWKATAKAQKLMTRTRTGEEQQGVAILCDMTRYGRREEEYLPLENKLLEALLAWGIFLRVKIWDLTHIFRRGRRRAGRCRGFGTLTCFMGRRPMRSLTKRAISRSCWTRYGCGGCLERAGWCLWCCIS